MLCIYPSSSLYCSFRSSRFFYHSRFSNSSLSRRIRYRYSSDYRYFFRSWHSRFSQLACANPLKGVSSLSLFDKTAWLSLFSLIYMLLRVVNLAVEGCMLLASLNCPFACFTSPMRTIRFLIFSLSLKLISCKSQHFCFSIAFSLTNS